MMLMNTSIYQYILAYTSIYRDILLFIQYLPCHCTRFDISYMTEVCHDISYETDMGTSIRENAISYVEVNLCIRLSAFL